MPAVECVRWPLAGWRTRQDGDKGWMVHVVASRMVTMADWLIGETRDSETCNGETMADWLV